jgi:hypothetical protein
MPRPCRKGLNTEEAIIYLGLAFWENDERKLGAMEEVDDVAYAMLKRMFNVISLPPVANRMAALISFS